jgi:hypothetical protein
VAVQRISACLIAIEDAGLAQVGSRAVECVEVRLRRSLCARDSELLVLMLAGRRRDALAAPLGFLDLGTGPCRLLVQVVGLSVQEGLGGERVCVRGGAAAVRGLRSG